MMSRKEQSSRIARRPLALLTAVLMGLLCVLLPACKQSKGGPPPGMKIPVVVSRVVEQTVREEVRAVGDIAADENVELRSEIDGRIDKIEFDEGQMVEAGAVLMRVDQEKLSAALQEARASLDLARANLKRSKELLESRTISQREYDQAEAEFLATEAVNKRLNQQLRDATVTAPFSGVMGARLVSPGQYVQKGQALSSIVALDQVKAEFALPERHLAALHDGQTVLVEVAAYPKQVFEGKIFFISPEVDLSTRTVLVKARVANPERKLRAGMLAQVATVLSERNDALVIPETAVMLQKNAARVFVPTDEGSVEARDVQLGMQLPGKLEITEGLRSGELVVSEGTQKIGPGVPIAFEEPGIEPQQAG